MIRFRYVVLIALSFVVTSASAFADTRIVNPQDQIDRPYQSSGDVVGTSTNERLYIRVSWNLNYNGQAWLCKIPNAYMSLRPMKNNTRIDFTREGYVWPVRGAFNAAYGRCDWSVNIRTRNGKRPVRIAPVDNIPDGVLRGLYKVSTWHANPADGRINPRAVRNEWNVTFR